MKIEHKNKEIEIGGKILKFVNEEIASAYKFGNTVLIVLQGDYPQKEKNYNNVIAVNASNGIIIWEVEEDSERDFKNPYEGAIDAGSYFILFKANSDKVPVNKMNGRILRNMDLMTGQRPW